MSSHQAFPLAPRWYPLRVASLLAMALLATLIVLRSNHQYALRRDFSQCEANLHQLGEAMLLYAQDYDQTLPCMWTGADGNGQAGGWLAYRAWPNASPGDLQPERGVLAPYVHSRAAFTCPSDGSRRGCSYAMNARLTVDGARNGGFHPGRRLADVVTPDHTLMLVEACSPPLPGRRMGARSRTAPWHGAGIAMAQAALI